MKPWIRIAITSACLVAGIVLLNARSQGHTTPLHRPFDNFPTRIGAWTGQEATRLDVETLNILKVSEGGKDVMYYLAKNDVSEKNHDEVCSGTKPATVTGVVSDEGKGAKKKKLLTASAIQIK